MGLPAHSIEGDYASARFPALGWLKAASIGALLGILYTQHLVGLFDDWWNEPSLSHGLLIPPLAAFLVWHRRASISALPTSADLRGLLLILLACSMYALGNLAAEFFLSRISFVVMLGGLIWTFWGLPRFHGLRFPLLLLATMVPLPSILYNTISAPLKLLASGVSTALVQALGVTVHRDGNLIHLARITLGVEEACSGLSALSALVVTSLMLGFLLGSSHPVRIVLLAASVPVAIAANIVRVAGTALIADFQPDLAMGFYHLFSGWLVFVVGFAMLFGLERCFTAIARLRK